MIRIMIIAFVLTFVLSCAAQVDCPHTDGDADLELWCEISIYN